MPTNEQARGRFNSDRLFHVGGGDPLQTGWHIETREGIKGPFLARAHAEFYLQNLKKQHPRKRISNWHGTDKDSRPAEP